MAAYNPDIPLDEFNRLIIDNVGYTIEGRVTSDKFSLTGGGIGTDKPVHIDEIHGMFRAADEVVLER